MVFLLLGGPWPPSPVRRIGRLAPGNGQKKSEELAALAAYEKFPQKYRPFLASARFARGTEGILISPKARRQIHDFLYFRFLRRGMALAA